MDLHRALLFAALVFLLVGAISEAKKKKKKGSSKKDQPASNKDLFDSKTLK